MVEILYMELVVNTNEFEWIDSLKPKLLQFLNNMSSDNFASVRYSYSGDIPQPSQKWGLGNLVFTAKILYISGLLDEIGQKAQQQLSESILTFSDRKGYLYDPYVTRLSFWQHVQKKLGLLDASIVRHVAITRVAETRQAFAALYLLGKNPPQPFLHIPSNTKEVEKYLSSFDWSHPWGAGSYFSHLLFFLWFNANIFRYHIEENLKLIQYAVNWMMKLQSQQDGCWYAGTGVPLRQKINGAMKILTGLHVAGVNEFPYPERLIDTALSAINDNEACSNFNVVYVLYGARKQSPDYRSTEVREFLKNRLRLYREYYHPEKGGFSFLKQKANETYYGKRLTVGKNEPDIHGTILFVWGLSIINQMMDIGLDFKVPLN